MQKVRGLLFFWYDFIVGDDWTMAAGIVLALALTAILAHNGIVAWWVMPIATWTVLLFSLARAGRKANR
jgi:hypothetical protein